MPRPLFHRASLFSIILALMTLLGSSCATAPASSGTRAGRDPEPVTGQPLPQPELRAAGSVGSEEVRAFRQLQESYNSASYDAVLTGGKAFAQKFPRSYQLPAVLNLQGMAHLLSRRPSEAISYFSRSAAAAPRESAFAQYVTYNLASARFESGQVDEALRTLAGLRAELLDLEHRAKLSYLTARILLQKRQGSDTLREIVGNGRVLDSLDLKGTGGRYLNAFNAVLDRAAALVTDPMIWSTLYRENPGSPYADSLLFYGARAKSEAGDQRGGLADLRILAATYPQSRFYEAAKAQTPSEALNLPPMNPKVIGALLPMTGKFARFGQKTLQAIELALGIYGPGDSRISEDITLVVEDTGDDAVTALKALDRLVARHRASVVIGPLLSKGIDSITLRAQELGVPLVSLARYSGSLPGNMIQAGLTIQQQVEQVAQYAMNQLGFKKFAIVYPKDKTGQEAANAFWEYVEKNGGKITGAESYAPGETDFRTQVDKLSGLFNTEARAKELADLAKLREEKGIKKRNRLTEKYYALPPIVEYEAVFIPEEARVASQIIPTFAFRDVDNVKFLGLSAWNSTELPARLQNGGDGNLVFVDAFAATSQRNSARDFLRDFREEFGAEPSSMEAIAYDVGKVVGRALSSGGFTSREDVRQKIVRTLSYDGVAGSISVQDGRFDRKLTVLTLKQGQILPLLEN